MWPSKDSEILQGFIMTKNVAFILNSLNFCTIQVCCRHTAHGLRLNQKYFAMLKIFLPLHLPPPYTTYPAIQHSNKNKTQIKLLPVPRCKSSAFLTWCWLSRRYKNCHPPFHLVSTIPRPRLLRVICDIFCPTAKFSGWCECERDCRLHDSNQSTLTDG